MGLLESTKFLLRRHRIFPKRFFGQNFMIEASLFERMSDYASLSKDDVVLDVGAGFGFLTRFVANKCKRVLAVEFDAGLVDVLCEQLEDVVNVEIIMGDVLKVSVPEFNKVVSIPPYRISSRLLLWLFGRGFDCAVLVFQREFANRLVASIGCEDYGWLTVFAYYYVDVEVLDSVSKEMFYPMPEVDSVVVRLKFRKQRPFQLKDEALFKRMVRSLFAQRNRKVRNAVLSFLRGVRGVEVEEAVRLAVRLPFCDKRVRDLAPEDFGVLANVLSD